ncbi:MAG TPA: chromate transporter [Candidatus Baltobacteraceae bacterium]|jgi:chromate transporter|nr:chromate transporter [Candidatus Baltobacteraceae bacterium]
MSADAAAPAVATAKPSLLSVALTFAAISSTAFGGGQKASIRHQVVSKGWMDNELFMDGLELAQVLPGPNILNLAIYCGQRVRGISGAIAAFLGASVPPFVIVLIAGALYFKYSSNPYVHGALRGCAVGALGLTLGNALELSWDERDDWMKIVLLILTAVAVTYFKMPLLLTLVLFGGIGIAREYRKSRKAKANS